MQITSLRSPAAALFFALLVLPQIADAAAPRPPRASPRPQPREMARVIPLPLVQTIPPAQRMCDATTASGVGYRVLRAGTGARPAAADSVTVNYIGYLATTGVVFDQGMGARFPVGGVIPGFGEGLQLMATGSIYRLCIPAARAYGERATGPIPANSDLVFQVELVGL